MLVHINKIEGVRGRMGRKGTENGRAESQGFQSESARWLFSKLLNNVIESLKSASSLKELSLDHRQKLLQIELLRTKSEPLGSLTPRFTSLFMMEWGELVLKAFSGRTTDHQRIKVGNGVRGTAVVEGRDENVPDVTARENHIACNRFTRSELVVLLRKTGEIVRQIDVDSDILNTFSREEEAGLMGVGDALGDMLCNGRNYLFPGCPVWNHSLIQQGS